LTVNPNVACWWFCDGQQREGCTCTHIWCAHLVQCLTSSLRIGAPDIDESSLSCCAVELRCSPPDTFPLCCRLRCQLARLEQREGGWIVTYLDHGRATFKKITAEFVVICTGIYSLPHLPVYQVCVAPCACDCW
jgi:hypothetical protein